MKYLRLQKVNFIINYFNLINKSGTNFGDVTLKHLYKNVRNTLYIDNDD